MKLDKKECNMTHKEFFQLQAGNLLRDFQTQYKDESEAIPICRYKSRFFDVDDIVLYLDIDEEQKITLMKCQHIIAQLAGFKKWADLISASEPVQELGRLLVEYRDDFQNGTGIFESMENHRCSVLLEEWEMYAMQNLQGLNDEAKLAVFKKVFLDINEIEPAKMNEIKKENAKMNNYGKDEILLGKTRRNVKSLGMIFQEWETKNVLEHMSKPVQTMDGTWHYGNSYYRPRVEFSLRPNMPSELFAEIAEVLSGQKFVISYHDMYLGMRVWRSMMLTENSRRIMVYPSANGMNPLLEMTSALVYDYTDDDGKDIGFTDLKRRADDDRV